MRLGVEHVDLHNLWVIALNGGLCSGSVAVPAVGAAVFARETAFNVACEELIVLDVDRVSIVHLSLPVEARGNVNINLALGNHLLRLLIDFRLKKLLKKLKLT